ncbi:hypothetical protein EST38_g13863 [Candolleomyces aberdarensis]|uniref:MULE transposase domain-containing protein n=1 Tax=Candolleomyces aberdarensis TaxID=2316362 RepID=A0A4Q2CZY3_9AGAR|nr:hypothetical protein EST38_g13863 [Candolleomyces aberdarensis]
METWNPETANFRYQLLPTDNTSLYRQFSRRNGIDVRKSPQYNIDDWLNPDSSDYNKTLAEAIFYYCARSEAGERFKVCISTQEMTSASWRYAHRSQLVLDGTFGVCSSRLLLFIALAQNQDGKGLPIAFFLFSAPTGNRATHAGYNTEILAELLSQWKLHLDKNRPSELDSSTGFEPFVAITDTDTKERAALLRVWVGIILLLCKFHLRQCWTNHRKTAVTGRNGSDDNTSFWKGQVVKDLQSLEIQLIATSNYQEATRLVNMLRIRLQALTANPASSSAAQGGLKHIDYLVANWMPLPLWQSWSEFGRLAASARLNIPVHGVIPTTNHLESFNGILKRKHLAQWLHSGHRLRFDALISLLVTKILPGVYAHHTANQKYKEWLTRRFWNHSDGQDLYQVHQDAIRNKAVPEKTLLCWWAVDDARDNGAVALSLEQRILGITLSDNGNTYLAEVASLTRWNGIMANYRDNKAGACKHLRALRLAIYQYISQGNELATFYFPQTRKEAEDLVTRLKQMSSDLLNAASSSTLDPPGNPEALCAPPVLSFDTYDPVAVQALGDDTTMIGDADDKVETTSSMDIGMDVDGSGTDSELDILIESRESKISQQEAAIAIQLQSKLNFEVQRALPLLYGINSLLDSSSGIQTPFTADIPTSTKTSKSV